MSAIGRTGETPRGSDSRRTAGDVARQLVADANSLDHAIYDAIVNTPTPTLDVAMGSISNAATYSRIWIATAGVLAAAGGNRGGRAAIRGLTAVGVTSIAANLVGKHLFYRSRPDRSVVVAGREARMPTSSSFPSGHAASAFAFATAVTTEFPWLSLPLYGLATVVGYSRIHVGVHYPSDVMGGGVLGSALGSALR